MMSLAETGTDIAFDTRVATRETRMTDEYRGAGDLLTPLATRVPGLTTALDPELAASQIERTLLQPGGKVHQVTPGALWYQPDGACSLRYRVAVSAGTGEVSEHTVVARMYPNDGAAGRSLDTEAPRLAPADNPPIPWRAMDRPNHRYRCWRSRCSPSTLPCRHWRPP